MGDPRDARREGGIGDRGAQERGPWYQRCLVTVSREDKTAKAASSHSNPPPTLEVPDHRSLGLRDGLAGLRDLMDRLLGVDGCPWDRQQTLDSLRPYLLEEAHEVLEAMEDPREHRTELGDLLFQIVFHSALRERQGAFDLDDVIAGIRTKMIRRHPHVFGDTKGRKLSADEVTAQWETIKAAERAERGKTSPDSADNAIPNPLTGVPRGLPALNRAWRLQEKAAAVGFDWPDIEGALDKWQEEWAEFHAARTSGDPASIRDEYGDLLFVLVRIGQKLNLDAEDALRRANAKFETRFAHVMRRCHEAGLDPSHAGLEQLEAFWQDAKTRESPPE